MPIQAFLPKLQDHLLGRLLGRDFDGDTYGSFTLDERQTLHILSGKMYSVQTVRGHSSALPFPFHQLPLVSRDFRSSSISVTSSVVFLIEPTAEELPSSFRPAVHLPPSAPFIFIYYFSLWRDGITPSVIIFPIVPLSF